MRVVSKELDKNREKIALQIKQELGFPINFKQIKTGWRGFSLYISMHDISILDAQVPVAFIKIDNIKIFPEIKTLLFGRTPKIKKIILQGLKMVTKWDPKEGFTILGLQGESIPSSIDYAALMTSLSNQEHIVIKDAEINWRIPNRHIKHLWQGKLNWNPNGKKARWHLEGTQQLQIDGRELPTFDVALEATSALDKIILKVWAKNAAGECQLESTTQDPIAVSHALTQTKAVANTDLWRINCQGHVQKMELANLQQYYVPKSTDPEILQWLLKAVPRGTINDGTLKAYGLLDTLQWEGSFKFKDVDFHYAANWPELTQVIGTVAIENKKINAQLLEGKILGWPIEKVSLRLVPEKKNEEPIIQVKGSIQSTLEAGLLFLQRTSQLTSIAQYLGPLDPAGPMHLDLSLRIPLKEAAVKVEGIVSTQAGSLKIPSLGMSLSQVQGNFHFTEDTLSAVDIKAALDEKPLEINIETKLTPKKAIEINTKGEFSAEFFQEKFQLPKFFNGQSLFNLTFKTYLDTKNTEWILNSDLKGITVQLPTLLNKSANAIWATTLSMETQSQKEETRVALHIRDLLNAKLIIDNSGGLFKLKRGHLVLGKGLANWTVKDVLSIEGGVDNLDVQEWLSFLGKNKATDLKNLPTLNVNLFVHDLGVYGLHFDKTWIMTSTSLSDWVVDGPTVRGKIRFPTGENDSTHINLDYLNVLHYNADPNSKNDFLKGAKKPTLYFHCQHLQYKEKWFGETSFKLFPKPYGYDIQELNVKTSVSELEGNGEWHLEESKPYTLLRGEVFAANMEKTFLNWGYPSAIRDASGHIKYKLRWPKSPFQFHISAVEGAAELKLDKGRILGVDPGLGRVMGLLNIENIKRRLQLDFSDLFKQGFVFDSLKAKLNFKQGKAETEGFLIDGPSAKIELAGNANLENKAIDLKMTVVPHAVGMGFPLAAAITGNPAIGAIGAGVWVINKLTGKINQLTQHQYYVTGTWDEPKIQEISNH